MRTENEMTLAGGLLRRAASVIGLLALLFGSTPPANAQCTREALASFGQPNPYGFPAYYVDQAGDAVEMCLDVHDPLCAPLASPPNPNAPLDVASGNFFA